MDKKELQRRAGILTEQPIDMPRMEQYVADNYLNGNISDVKNIIHNLNSDMAAAMALRVYLYLNDVNPQHAGGFAKIIIEASR